MADNGVTIENTPNIVVITDSDQNQVVVTQPVVNVIEVNTPGPRGPQGNQGPSGSQGPPGDELFTELSSSLYYTTSSLQVTGSISVTGGVSGSFSGSGADLSNIPATAIVGLNLSQIASGSYTASISPSTGFKVNTSASFSGSIDLSGSLTGVTYVGFNTSSINTQPVEGKLSWNNTDGTLDIGLKGGNVTLQVGQETVARVVNKTGGDLLESEFKVVRIRSVAEGGAQGQRLAVVLAQADSDADSATTLGVVTENIALNQEGFITIFGLVRGIDTTGANSWAGSETWVDGDMLYLSPFHPGYLTNVKPTAPNHLVIVGYVEYAHPNNGKLFIKIDNGWELGELHDVLDTTTTSSYGDLLVKSGSVWTNSKQLTGSYSITGSLTVSGSSTFTNIGPAIFSGSVSTNNVFTGSGAGLTNIPASSITGLNLSQIASGSATASISPDLGFQVNTSASITGSLSVSGVITGSGAGITNISASSIVGLNLSQIASGSVTASVNVNTDSFTLSSGSNTLFEVDNDGHLYSYGTASLKETKVTGSLLVSQNLTVLGTASFTQVTSSVIIVGSSTITLSTDDPVVRFGGIVVVDSGSFGTNSTGSLLWDSEEDRWIYVTPSGSPEGYNSAILIGGPPNTGSVGQESGLTAGRIMKATGDDHIGSSLMRETGSIVSVDGNFEISGSLEILGSVSASEFTGSGLGIVNAQIGDPTDGTYSDGFFDTFTTSTKLADALDEISEAFLDLAPAKAQVLTNTNMSRTNPAVFTGYLAGGLNPQWYATASAYSQYTTLTAATNVDLRATGSRAGKASDISASLIGGVTSSRAYGTAAFATVDSRSLSSGLGSSNTIDIDFLGTFNTFWAIFSASIDDTITQTGSVQYKISADNGAGTTNPFQLFYVGGAGDFPNQSISGVTCVTSSTTFNYLSGITMLRGATFTVGFTGSDLFNPVYNLNQVSLTSSFFTTLTTGSNTPLWNDTLRLTVTRSLSATTHSGQATGTGNITVSKPNKSNVATSYTLSNSYINSYTSAQSTNNNNTQNDIFVDEAQRYTNLQTAGWASGSALVDGNLQVQNARLIVGRWGDYGAFVSGSTSLSTSYANYFRDSIPGTTNRIAGTFSILRNTNAFAASTPISAWGSGGRLEAVLVLKADVTGTETANFYYDLGRAVGSNAGNIIGIRNTITTNNTTTYTVTWALPAGVNTGANGCVVWIRYRNTPNTDFIRSLTITYS